MNWAFMSTHVAICPWRFAISAIKWGLTWSYSVCFAVLWESCFFGYTAGTTSHPCYSAFMHCMYTICIYETYKHLLRQGEPFFFGLVWVRPTLESGLRPTFGANSFYCLRLQIQSTPTSIQQGHNSPGGSQKMWSKCSRPNSTPGSRPYFTFWSRLKHTFP